jgi:hypothetical protein
LRINFFSKNDVISKKHSSKEFIEQKLDLCLVLSETLYLWAAINSCSADQIIFTLTHQQLQIQKHQTALSRSCGSQHDLIWPIKTTRQLSKINPYVGEFEGRRSVPSMGGVGVRTPTLHSLRPEI